MLQAHSIAVQHPAVMVQGDGFIDLPRFGVGVHRTAHIEIFGSFMGYSWALLAQVAETDIQFEGRWKSDAFKLYFRMPLQYRFGVTEKMQHWAAEH